ncbi:MAG TPA: TMEM175 family protein [Acidimicrobiales bacterium]|nr:TMEM175 family protein [Acidimicrobiales bacterium]
MDSRRTEALSDSTFAVAMTLLIFDVRLPDVRLGHHIHGVAADLWFQEWSHYLGYVVSFVVVGMIWVCHHTIFRMLRGIDHTGMLINLGLLGLVVFIPFPTQVMAAYLGSHDSGLAPVAAFYGLSLGATTLLLAILWHHVSRGRRLIEPWIPDDAITRLTRRYYLTPVLYLVATGVAIVNQPAGLVLLLLVACVYLLHTGTRAAPKRPPHHGHPFLGTTRDAPDPDPG